MNNTTAYVIQLTVSLLLGHRLNCVITSFIMIIIIIPFFIANCNAQSQLSARSERGRGAECVIGTRAEKGKSD